MKYTLSKPRKLANGKAASYWGVRVRMESAYEEQAVLAAFLKLSPAERKSVLGRKAVG